jgi:hypothetical protein
MKEGRGGRDCAGPSYEAQSHAGRQASKQAGRSRGRGVGLPTSLH